MLNDLVIDKKNGFIYITDSAIWAEKPTDLLNGGLIVIDIN